MADGITKQLISGGKVTRGYIGASIQNFTAEMAEFHSSPDAGSDVVFKAEAGVIGRILECQPDWCRLSVEGDKGWLPKADMWGADPGEIVE